MTLKYNFYTDIGDRNVNEDSLIATEKNGAYLFAVADGLGGEGGGDVASQTVIRELKVAFENANFELDKAILQANLSVLETQKAMRRKMKSTCAAVFVNFASNKTVIASVGDSRVYLFKNGEIMCQTRDHSAATVAVATGEISPEEIRGYKDRNILTRALGMDDELKVQMLSFENTKYDHILICSDGFWEFVTEAEMTSALNASKSLEDWLERMRFIHKQKADLNCDNNTAIIAEIT